MGKNTRKKEHIYVWYIYNTHGVFSSCCIYIYIICISYFFLNLVEMRNTCQVTNQSSHGELSFHHNPHLRLCWGLGLFTSRVVRSGGSRLKNAALPTYCHCCEFCALKQKPGVLLEKTLKRIYLYRVCTCDQTKNKSQLQTVLITASGPQA